MGENTRANEHGQADPNQIAMSTLARATQAALGIHPSSRLPAAPVAPNPQVSTATLAAGLQTLPANLQLPAYTFPQSNLSPFLHPSLQLYLSMAGGVPPPAQQIRLPLISAEGSQAFATHPSQAHIFLGNAATPSPSVQLLQDFRLGAYRGPPIINVHTELGSLQAAMSGGTLNQVEQDPATAERLKKRRQQNRESQQRFRDKKKKKQEQEQAARWVEDGNDKMTRDSGTGTDGVISATQSESSTTSVGYVEALIKGQNSPRHPSFPSEEASGKATKSTGTSTDDEITGMSSTGAIVPTEDKGLQDETNAQSPCS